MNHIFPLQELSGWVAAVLTLLAFSCTNIVRLRYVALAANAAFITYGLTAELWPVLALHSVLVPINLWRLRQTRRTSPTGPARKAVFSPTRLARRPTNLPDGSEKRPRAVARWLGCVALAAVASSIPTGGSTSRASAGLPVAPPVLAYPTRPTFDAPEALTMHAFALNALLAPLIDESLPERWTDVGLDVLCDPGTRVLVDGQPMVAGSPVPAVAFTVRWDIGQCQPLGANITLSGRVDLLVTHDSGGMSAVVVPDGLRMHTPEGRFSLRGPFTANLSFGTPTHAMAAGQHPPTRRAATSNGLSR